MRQVHILMVTCFLFLSLMCEEGCPQEKKEPENIREAAGSNKDNQGQQIKEKMLLIADNNKKKYKRVVQF